MGWQIIQILPGLMILVELVKFVLITVRILMFKLAQFRFNRFETINVINYF